MQIRLSAHGAYHHQYHLVWIPKHRTRVLEGDLKACLAKRLGEIRVDHPDVEVEQFSIQVDHVPLVAVIPPKYAVSAVVGQSKANTSREIRQRFPWVKKMYGRNEFWSGGFFSSTVGISENSFEIIVSIWPNVGAEPR
jgi:putative transposase